MHQRRGLERLKCQEEDAKHGFQIVEAQSLHILGFGSGMRFQRDAWLNSGDSTKRRII